MTTPSSAAAEPLSTAEERLVRAIAGRHGALLQDLEQLVNIPTGRAPHPAALDGLAQTRTFMRSRLEALGAVSEMVPGDPRPGWLDGPVHFRDRNRVPAPIPATLVCRREGVRGNARPVLLSGHLDTVHDPDPAAEFRSLSISADRKTATGPGVVDMKGGLVIALHALEALAEVGLEAPFGFILNSDEETGSFHSDRSLRAEASRRAPDGACVYAAALALEPASGPTGLVVARGGSGQAVLEARGRAAHVGRDFASGRSATDLLARVIVAAHGMNDAARGSIVNVSTLWCDQPANQVSDHAAAWANLRYPTQPAGEHLAAGLSQICARVGGDDVDAGGVRCETSLIRPAKPLTPAVQSLAEHVRSAAGVLGQTVTFTSTAGVCDGNNLQAGVADGSLPVLDTLGVRGGGLHTPEEWIDLGSLVERCQLLALVMHRLASAG